MSPYADVARRRRRAAAPPATEGMEVTNISPEMAEAARALIARNATDDTERLLFLDALGLGS